MSKLILHGMSRADWMVSGVEYYEHRAIVTASDGDILVFSCAPDPAYLLYREKVLGFRKDNIIIAGGSGTNLAQRIFNDPHTLLEIKSRITSDFEMDVFYVSVDERRLADELGILLLGDHELTEVVGSKSGFRDLARKAGVPISDGMENLGLDQVNWAVRAYISQEKPIVIKDDQGVSGLGNFRIDPQEVNGDLNQVVQRALQQINFRCGVVEEWKDGVVSSLGIQGYITDDDCLLLSDFWQQILEGVNCKYIGSSTPVDVPDFMRQSIFFDVYRLMEEYQSAGWRGNVNFDLIICEDNTYFFVECNARKSAPYYPRRFAELCGVTAQPIMSTLIFSETLKQLSFSELLKLSQGLLFSREDPRGIVFYNDGIMRCGEIQVIIVGNTHEELSGYREELQSRLNVN